MTADNIRKANSVKAGLVMTLCFAGMLGYAGWDSNQWLCLISVLIVLVAAIIGFVLFDKIDDNLPQYNEIPAYILRINTAGNDVDAIGHINYDEIKKINEAFGKAMQI